LILRKKMVILHVTISSDFHERRQNPDGSEMMMKPAHRPVIGEHPVPNSLLHVRSGFPGGFPVISSFDGLNRTGQSPVQIQGPGHFKRISRFSMPPDEAMPKD